MHSKPISKSGQTAFAGGIHFTLHSWRNRRPLFFRMSCSSVTRASSFFSRLISSASSLSLALDAANFFFHSYRGMLAHAEALKNLRNQIASLRDLTLGVALKIFPEIRLAHDALPASKLGKKASTNQGAIHRLNPHRGNFLGSPTRINLWRKSIPLLRPFLTQPHLSTLS